MKKPDIFNPTQLGTELKNQKQTYLKLLLFSTTGALFISDHTFLYF